MAYLTIQSQSGDRKLVFSIFLAVYAALVAGALGTSVFLLIATLRVH
jgi:hypothetical protein